MGDTVRLEVLGTPRLVLAGKPIRTTPFHVALLSRLLLEDGDTIGRAEAARLLWPDSPLSSARHNLSQVLYSLKKATGGFALVYGTPQELRLGGISSDIADLRVAIAQSDWPTADRLCRGPLLDRFFLPRASVFNDWVDSQRFRLAALAAEVAEGLRLEGLSTQAAGFESRIGSSTVAWGDIEMRLPLDTPAHERAAPQDARSGGGAASSERGWAPFIGRRETLAQLEQLFVRSTTSGFTTVAVEGEPGIGKTAVTERFARRRALRGSYVLTARAFLAEQNVPFGVVAQWVRELGRQHFGALGEPWIDILTDAFPGLILDLDGRRGTASAPGGEYRILEALRRLFLHVADQQPLLLVLDDAPLADPASLSFVHYFSRRSAPAPVLFVATVRIPSLLGTEPFPSWPEVYHLKVDPLPLRDVESLMCRLSGSSVRPSADEVAELSRRTGGNPLLLVSLLGTRGANSPTAIPDSIMAFFVPRLEALSADAGLLLAAISIAGDRIDFEVAATIAGFGGVPDRTTVALAQLESAALVLSSGDGSETVTVRHGIVAEVAVARLPAATRRALYGRAARTLAEVGRSPPAVVAVQHDIAGDRNRAFEAALSAAAASKDLHATREQEFFLKLALSNAPDRAAEGKVRIDLADLFRRLGRLRDALEIVAEAAMASTPRGLRRQAQANRLLTRLSKVDPQLNTDDVWTEIQDLEKHLDPHLTAELYFQLAAATHDLGHTGHTVVAAERSLAISRQLQPSPRSALLASQSAMAIGLYTHAEDGIAAIDQLIPAVQGNPEALAQCVAAQATLLVASGRLTEAEIQFLHCIELAERCYLYATLFVLHNNLGVCYTEQGRYPEARGQLEEAARVGQELIGPSDAAIAADNLCLLYFELGEYEVALRNIQEHPKAGDTRSPRSLFLRHALVGLCALELGLLSKAFELKREIDLLLKQREYWSSDVSYVEAFLARMLVLEGKPEAARARLETALEVYRGRDMMCRSRLELELARIDLKTDPGAALERAQNMLEVLRGTGARPLIERFEEMVDRARLRSD
jgi:tetratricopeptide (TPR) repeat protein